LITPLIGTNAQAHEPDASDVIFVNHPPTPYYHNSETVSGTFTVEAEANWSQGVTAFELQDKTGEVYASSYPEGPPYPDHVELSYTGSTFDLESWTYGTYYGYLVARVAGRPGEFSQEVKFGYTGNAPTGQILSPEQGSMVSGNVPIKFEYDYGWCPDCEPSQILIFDDYEQVFHKDVFAGGSMTYDWDTTGKRFGYHEIRLIVSGSGYRTVGSDSTHILWPLYVVNPDQVKSEFHFAEGTTRYNFSTLLCLGNPNGVPANVVVISQTPYGVINRGVSACRTPMRRPARSPSR
jgi:hypothetical protein